MSGWGAIYNNTLFGLQQQTRTLARLQEQVSTGARINRASDDPSDASRILRLRSQSYNLDHYIGNLDDVVLSLNHGYNLMSEVQDAVVSVKTALTQAASGTYSAENRATIAIAVDSALEQAVLLANGAVLGRYVFAGSASSVLPYEVTREDGKIVSVRYVGGDQDMPVPVAPGVRYSGQLVGNDIFRCDDRQAPEFLGSTGVAGGAGTSSITGDVWLSMAHTLTKYDDVANPGIAAGTDSASGDTILGSHTLTLAYDGAGGTGQLNGGTAVTFTGIETNLEVTDPDGHVVYLVVSSMSGTPYTGDVTIKGEGRMSVDGGNSWTDFVDTDFATGNISVADAETGKFLYVDGATVNRTGVEPVRIKGTYDVFNLLIGLRDLLNNEQGLSEQEQVSSLQHADEAINEVIGVITRQTTASGSRLEALDRLRGSLEELKANADDEAGAIENADLVALAVELAKANTLYQLTMQTAARLLNQTLMDYI